jgi:hypothetical protein
LSLHLLEQLVQRLNHVGVIGGLGGNDLFFEDRRLRPGLWILLTCNGFT